MIGYRSEKIEKEYMKAAVALRLIVERLSLEFPGTVWVFRVDAPTKFENGIHSTGLAMDVELEGATELQLFKACQEVNALFPVKNVMEPVCRPKVNKANFPSGKRMDRPHVHVQISWTWKTEPKSFLREFGYIENIGESK